MSHDLEQLAVTISCGRLDERLELLRNVAMPMMVEPDEDERGNQAADERIVSTVIEFCTAFESKAAHEIERRELADLAFPSTATAARNPQTTALRNLPTRHRKVEHSRLPPLVAV
jgi:hypothetical protein